MGMCSIYCVREAGNVGWLARIAYTPSAIREAMRDFHVRLLAVRPGSAERVELWRRENGTAVRPV